MSDQHPQAPTAGALDDEAFEDLLARCIDASGAGDAAALERLLVEHAPLAARLRARLADLERLGLLEEGELAPERVAGHRILSPLGRGGMGAVYVAEDPRGERVALKLASVPLAGDDAGRRARARFEREVHAVAQLDHPRLIAVRASGEHEGRPWFTMDLVRGATLASVIERLRARGSPAEDLSAADARAALLSELEAGRLPGDAAVDVAEHADAPAWSGGYVAWCCRVVHDLASALEHAHACGVVHRDVKPSNVLVRPDGRALLFDFGLALVADQPTLTRSGDFAGTPYAVAPEQIERRRGAVGGRTDVWGLGVVLYELLALRRPFDGAGPAALLRRVLEADPLPLRRLSPGLPHALEHVVESALEKSPRRRMASARALREDLERFLDGRGVLARGASTRRRAGRFVRRRPAAATAFALALLVALGLPAGLLAANRAVREHARRAERAAEEAGRLAAANAEVVGYLVDLFEPLGEGSLLRGDGALAVLEAQAQRLEAGLGEQPLARAALLEATGTVFASLGDPARARPLYDRALAIRQTELGEAHPETAALLARLAHVCVETGDAPAALGLCARALAALEAGPDESPALVARVRATSARALTATGRADEAATQLERALGALRARPGLDAAVHADVLGELARAEAQLERPAQALRRAEEALAWRRATWFPEPHELVRALELAATLRDEAGAAAARDEAQALRAALLPQEAGPAPPPSLALRDPAGAEYETSFQAGITALQARRLDEARARFERCLELRPASGVCLYNLACAHALADQPAAALERLEQATRAGFGVGDERLELIRRDADLARLRGLAGYEALLARVAADGAGVRAYAREPRVQVPIGLEPGDDTPVVLLVLHADGSTKDAVADGAWARAAEALGWLLVAPSAPRPRGRDPRDGMAWFESLDEVARDPWSREVALAGTVDTLLGGEPPELRRVVVAGEGSGALVAFDLALRAPGLVRGALLVQGPASLEVPAVRVRTAAALGLRVAARFDPAQRVPWVAPDVTTADYAGALAGWLGASGLGDESPAPALPAGGPARVEALVAALRALDPRGELR